MKAALCTHYGPPEELEYVDIPGPVPGKGQVTVAVKSCGVNFPDALLIQDKYQFKPALPFAPGGEIAGVVRQIGEGVSSLSVGSPVIASIGTGGFAEEALAEAARCIPIPDDLGFDVASAFVIAYGTAWHALNDRARLQAGETLVVLGAAGGVGLAAVEIGHAIGARVIAAASTEEKISIARAHGADDGFLYSAGQLDRNRQKAFSEIIKQMTGGSGADVLFDPVGGNYAEPAFRAMNWNGRYLVVGFAAGDIPRLPLNLTLLKGASIIGVFWGAAVARNPKKGFADLEELARWIVRGKLNPHISARVPLARAGDAIRLLMNRQAKGKVVVIP